MLVHGRRQSRHVHSRPSYDAMGVSFGEQGGGQFWRAPRADSLFDNSAADSAITDSALPSRRLTENAGGVVCCNEVVSGDM